MSNGIQLWTVPKTTTYTITIAGARGGGSSLFGLGQTVRTTLALTQGQQIKILVGQAGITGVADPTTGGGGGGSFIVSGTTPLVVAGGGGGAGSNGIHASYPANGRFASSQAGGSVATQFASSGGGFTANGQQFTFGAPNCAWAAYGQSFMNGGEGGTPSCSGVSGYLGGANGGFGGGGSTCACRTGGGGGGGGYTGGCGSGCTPSATIFYSGQGGTSYYVNAGTNFNTNLGVDGYVTIGT